MALPFDIASTAHDPRALTILAKTIYRELRGEGFAANRFDLVLQLGQSRFSHCSAPSLKRH